MQFQFDIASTSTPRPVQPLTPTTESVPELLKLILDMQREQFNQMNQMLELQREHLNHVRTAAQDNLARWRNLLARWEKEHPEFAGACKQAYPLMEKSYVQMLVSIVEEVGRDGEDALDNEFAVQEFLDRYGMKVGQLSHLLSIIGPLSEAAQQAEAASKQQQGGTQ